jgi:hypothetical protein
VKKVVRKIFGGQVFVPRDAFPSLNACHESGRAEGGTFGSLFRQFVEHRKVNFIDSQIKQVTNDFNLLEKLGLDPHHTHLESMEEVKGKVKEIRGTDFYQSLFPSIEILDEFEEFVDKGLQNVIDHPELNIVEPAAILEPLKVRIITKGNPFLNLRTLELQKMMHGRLREFSPFVAIGRPLTDQDFDERFSQKLDKDSGYCSGDYVASTDNLDPEISRAIWTEICRTVKVKVNKREKISRILGSPGSSENDVELLFTPYWQAGLLALTEHQLSYPMLDGKDTSLLYAQKWGQLMGSPMSFPILCIANYAASCVGLGIDPVESLNNGSPILVNGDDIAFSCSREQYSHWKEATSSIGLRPSLGKNYFSDEFLTMNSECRIPTASSSGKLTWTLTSYINISLLCGYDKKGTDAGSSILDSLNWWELGTRCSSLLRGVIHGRDRVLSEFLNIHDDILKKVPAGVSYYLPSSLGGVGLPLPLGEKAENLILESNLKFAAYVSCLDNKKRKQILHRPQCLDSSIYVHLSDIIEEELAEACGGYRWQKVTTTYRWLVNQGLSNSCFMSYILGQALSTNVLDDPKNIALKHIWSRQLWGKPGHEPEFAKAADLCYSVTRDVADNSVKTIEAAFEHRKSTYNWLLLKHYRKALSMSLEPMNISKALTYMAGYVFEAPWDSVTYPSSMRFRQPRLFQASDYSINKSENQRLSMETWAQFRDRKHSFRMLQNSYTSGFSYLGLVQPSTTLLSSEIGHSLQLASNGDE